MLAAFAAFGITIGLLLLTLHLIKRVHGRTSARGRVPLTILQRVHTGPRQAIGLLRVADRVLVVSLGEHGASLMTELTGESLDRVLASDPAALVDTPSAEHAASIAEPAFARALRAARTNWALRGLRIGAVLIALSCAGSVLRIQAQTAPTQDGITLPRVPAAPNGLLPAAPAAPTTNSIAGALIQRALGPNGLGPGVAAPGSAAAAAAGLPRVTSTVPLRATAPRPGHESLMPHTPSVPTPTVTPPGTPKIEFDVGQGTNQLKLTGTVGLVVFLGALTLLPALFLLMTSFTRILIVLSFLRTALGTQSAPPSQLLVALAVMLTGVVMHPVLDRVTHDALTPYFDGKITQMEAYDRGVVPFRDFMLANLRQRDIDAFVDMSGITTAHSVDDLPTVTIVAAFVTSELRTSFQMGFAIYLPFIVVDLIVASVLMSMGMMMVPPVMVSLPFKLLLFVLADGWTLIVRNLVASFHL